MQRDLRDHVLFPSNFLSYCQSERRFSHPSVDLRVRACAPVYM